MITGTVVLAGLAVALAILLILSSHYLPPAADPSADRLEQILPRIQCAQCGYPGCRAYAEAIAAGDIGSIAEARQIIRASFDVVEYQPQNKDAWDAAFEKFQALTR